MKWKACLFILFVLGILSLGRAFDARALQTCDDWVIRVESVQGSVQARKAGQTQWVPVELYDTYCAGVTLRVMALSRAAVVLPNDAVLRLDENTMVTIAGMENKETALIDFLSGAINFFSRSPRSLKINTPFVNAAVEGTEFFIKIEQTRASVFLFEGRLTASNQAGSLAMTRGQCAVAEESQAPVLRIEAKPRDAVHWSLYYPPVLDYRAVDFPGTGVYEGVRKSIESYWRGDLSGAFAALAAFPEDEGDPRCLIYRAGLLLTVGRAEEASALVDRALAMDLSDSRAFALQSVIAVTRNEKDRALALAKKAVSLDERSSAARVALSYAQQAHFDIKGALASLQEAVALAPDNALAWARLSELWLSTKYVDKALDAAQRALDLNPHLARTQTVLGFARLVQIQIRAAKVAFEKAIRLDQADPLPRLGFGLSKIRDGKLAEGRREIEIAVSLDPNNSLLRSYLGKAYFEEKREKQASVQFGIAKELDPLDPTPWFYDAIQKQTLNRPVEAIEDLQRSMALNNNRAVYRSRLLLDEDLAARGVSLARVYDDLGFQWLALNEGWKSLNTDPANHSAHRFLSDSYFSLPRHDIARVSELLQSQLLQPANIMPVQPQLAENRTFFSGGAGPRDSSYNEYTPLFERDRLSLLLGGAAGERSTFADEVVQSGTMGRFSYSLGQFHSETGGFRPNNQERTNIYDAFVQAGIAPRTSVQMEYRHSEFRAGDLYAFFDPDAFSTQSRENNRNDSFRFGLHHSFSPQSDLIGSFMYATRNEGAHIAYPGSLAYDLSDDLDGYGLELQHIFRAERFSLVAGVGHFDTDTDRLFTILDFPVPGMSISSPSKPDNTHTNFYLYSHVNYPESVTWTLGVSVDRFTGGYNDLNATQPNPKFGVMWTPFSGTTLRGAVFRTFKRTLLTNQTVEPTQVAGFNQFFDDGEGTDAWRYGVGLDQKLTQHLFAGAEFSWRELSIPYQAGVPGLPVSSRDGRERLGRGYLYWTPHPWFALGPEYQYERYEYSPDLPIGNLLSLDTHRIGLGVSFYHPTGFLARLRPMFVIQDGQIWDHNLQPAHADSDFVTLDASIGYRLPKRMGLIEVEARNLFDRGFRFQDTWPQNPRITPGRCILTRWTLSF